MTQCNTLTMKCDPSSLFDQLYPEEDFLTGDDLLFEYNPEVWGALVLDKELAN